MHNSSSAETLPRLSQSLERDTLLPQSPAAGHLLPDSQGAGPEPPPPALRAAVRRDLGQGAPHPARAGRLTLRPDFLRLHILSALTRHFRQTLHKPAAGRLGNQTQRCQRLTPQSLGPQHSRGRQGTEAGALHHPAAQREREPTQLPKGPGTGGHARRRTYTCLCFLQK